MNTETSVSLLWILRILGGLPALTAPLLWFGGLFAFLAEGLSDAQRMYILAGMAYPLVYIGCFIVSSGMVRAGDIAGAEMVMGGALVYLVLVLALWPAFGIK
jgi:cobalamin biosynthesis protein CobD/CbiB